MGAESRNNGGSTLTPRVTRSVCQFVSETGVRSRSNCTGKKKERLARQFPTDVRGIPSLRPTPPPPQQHRASSVLCVGERHSGKAKQSGDDASSVKRARAASRSHGGTGDLQRLPSNRCKRRDARLARGDGKGGYSRPAAASRGTRCSAEEIRRRQANVTRTARVCLDSYRCWSIPTEKRSCLDSLRARAHLGRHHPPGFDESRFASSAA